ncbi:MAG: hypothetical protein OEV91_11875 [Desulfobulbaceae bacterium]|nr:hypothetical protein [Desulfobulbaceae bacterium]
MTDTSAGILAGSAFFSIVILIFAALVLLAKRAAGKRRAEMENFCLANGFSFTTNGAAPGSPWDDDPGWKELLPGGPPVAIKRLEIFGTGGDAEAKNGVHVPFGSGNLLFFDYSYSGGTGDSSRSYSHTVALARVQAPLPGFHLRPARFLDRLAAMAGFNSIDLRGHEEFSKKYRLSGQDSKAVQMFFGPRAAVLEKSSGWHIKAGGNHIVLFNKEGRVPPADYAAYIGEVKELLIAIGLS